MEKEKEEIIFFHLLFPERLYSDIAIHTNAYAMTCIVDKLNAQWYPTTPEEIKAFLGAQCVMGVMPVPALDMYWYKYKLFNPSCLETTFLSTRFEHLQRYLHVADTSANPP